MSTETRLKPCPFCGGAAKEFERFNANVITCRRCGVKVRQSEMGEGDAAERWNQRATPVAAQAQHLISEVCQESGLPAPLDRAEVLHVLREADRLLTNFTSAEAIGAWREKVKKIGAGEIIDVPAQQPVSGAGGLADYPTHGMNLGQRIAHVGGRENAQGYVEFGSPMAVHALIQHVLRDFHRQGRVNLAPDQQDADKVDAERYRAWRDAAVANSTPFVRAMRDTLPPEAREGKPRWPTAAEWDAAIDAARKEQAR